jgi:hypothetical protein
LALALTGFLPSLAQADFVSYTATLTSGSPTFNRPLSGTPPTTLSAVGTNVYYNLQPFYVTVSGSYSMETVAPSAISDTFLVLYQNAFNPASPLSNAVSADDDSGADLLSLIGPIGLTAGVQYYLVTTTFDNGVTGSTTVQIGTTTMGVTPVLGIVPEPGSLALAGLGLSVVAGMAFRRSRRS